jgi:hypothetical protein
MKEIEVVGPWHIETLERAREEVAKMHPAIARRPLGCRPITKETKRETA